MIQDSRYAHIARYLTLVALITPLIISRSLFFPFITGKAIFFRVAIELALLCFILDAASQYARGGLNAIRSLLKPLRHPVSIAFIAFALASLLTALTALNPQLALWSNFERGDGAWQYLHYVLFFLLALLLLKTKGDWKTAAWINIGVSVLVSLYALLQIPAVNAFFNMQSIIGVGGRISGTLGNATYIGTYILFSLVWILWVLLESKTYLARATLITIGVFELAMLAYSGTRGAFLGFIVATIFLCIVGAARRLRPFEFQKSIARNIALWILILLFLIPITIFLTRESTLWKGIPIIERLIHIGDLSSINPRIWAWGSALQGFWERPLLGWGYENFLYVFDKYYNPKNYGGESWFDRAHNIYLDYAVSGGIILLGAFLAIFIGFFRMLVRQPKNSLKPLIAAMAIAYLVQGLTLFDVLPIFISLCVFLAFGVRAIAFNFEMPAREQKNSVPTERKKLPLLAPILTFLGIALSLYITNYLPFQQNRLLISAYSYGAGADPQTARSIFDRTLRFPSPVGQLETRVQLATFVSGYIGGLAQQNMALSDESLRTLLTFTNQWFEGPLKSGMPMSSKELYVVSIANMYAGMLTGNPDDKHVYFNQAKSYLEYGLSQAPSRVELLGELAKIAMLENDEEAANAIGQKLHELRPDLFPAATTTQL